MNGFYGLVEGLVATGMSHREAIRELGIDEDG